MTKYTVRRPSWVLAVSWRMWLEGPETPMADLRLPVKESPSAESPDKFEVPEKPLLYLLPLPRRLITLTSPARPESDYRLCL